MSPISTRDGSIGRWILGIAIACLVSIGGHAYVAMRSDFETLRESDQKKGERIAVLEANYISILTSINKMDNKLDDLVLFAQDMTVEQRSRNLYPHSSPKGHD